MNRLVDMENIVVHGRTFEPMLSAGEVQSAMVRIAAQISGDYADKDPLCVAILNGAFIFAADLVREMQFDPEIIFIKVASYQQMASTGDVKELIGLDVDISGREVIVIEDIVDTGHTINHLKQLLNTRGAASIGVATLLLKSEAYLYDTPVEYIGFSIPNRFVIGYGLDFDGHGRALEGIYVLKEE